MVLPIIMKMRFVKHKWNSTFSNSIPLRKRMASTKYGPTGVWFQNFCLTGWRMEFKPCNSHSRYATPTLQSSQVRSHWYCGICAGLAKRLPIVVRVFVLPFIRAPVAADMSLMVFPSSWRCVLSNQHETSLFHLFQTRFLLKKRMTSTKHDPPKGEGQNGKALLGKKLFTIFRLNSAWS